ncbi:flagellar motor protein MotB [Oceanibaculum pacificum]|uniref:Motility protein B-like N-terminal domain-containing protein n=1 Tax=Oceanibaculum pacificum TaxID=580166 RepID=A0A154W3T0_9PROT|nr:flagellar motor protein MotB [Oceanibaculum pacificum]KZD08123.1 hypothetical protein AUP43_08930 [Oceanibaculum pacificum]
MFGEQQPEETANPAAAGGQALLSLYLLLLAFFILLHSMSSFETERAQQVVEGVNQSFPSFLRTGTVGGDGIAAGGLAVGADSSAKLGALFQQYFALEPVDQAARADVYRVDLPVATLFPGDGADISPRGMAFFAPFAEILRNPPAGTRLEVELLQGGSIDLPAARAGIQTPAMARMSALAQALIAAGLPPDQLSVGFMPGSAQRIGFFVTVLPADAPGVTFAATGP